MKHIKWLAVLAVLAAGCGPASTSSTASTTSTATTTTAETPATVTTVLATTTTTTQAPTTTAAPAYGDAGILRAFLIVDGYGYLVDGSDDSVLDELGANTCDLAAVVDSWMLMTAAVLSVETPYSDDEVIELTAASLGQYCPLVTNRWTD